MGTLQHRSQPCSQLWWELIQQLQQHPQVKEGAPTKQLVDGWVEDGLV